MMLEHIIIGTPPPGRSQHFLSVTRDETSETQSRDTNLKTAAYKALT